MLLREPAMIPIGIIEIIFWLLQICIWRQDYRFIGLAGYLQTASILALLWPILKYRLYPQAIVGSVMVVVGSTLNKIVMYANDGMMPVVPSFSDFTKYYQDGALEAAHDMRHVIMSDSTKLNFLADYIDVGFSVISIGDVLVHLFTTIVICSVIAKLNQTKGN